MISDELKEIIDQIKEQGRMSFLEAATEEQIEKFEKENDILLPVKYKEWLRYSDGGDLYLPAGVQLYGVAHKPLIDIEDNDRPDDNYIVVGALASGEPVLFKKNEEKFYVYDHDSKELDDDLTYDDFFALLHPCSYPGCPKLTDKRFCEEHEKLSNSNYEKYGRDKSTKKRYGRAWKRIRDKYAAEHPFCELCFERGIIVPTEEIHHKLPLSEGGTHDRSNLIALCKSCHSTIHAKRGDYWGRTMSGGHRSCADRSGDPSRVGAGEISTGMAPRERRGGHACKIAK